MATHTISRVAIYARVSTANNGQSPEMQLRELREFCERRGWTVAGEFVDATSGAKDRRPELDRLLTDPHKRKFDVVAVWKFDRFARSVSHLLRALETFNALGIAFASLTEQVDTTTPAGKMVFTVLGAVAVSASLKRIHFRRFGVGHLTRRRVRNTPVRWLLHTSKQS